MGKALFFGLTRLLVVSNTHGNSYSTIPMIKETVQQLPHKNDDRRGDGAARGDNKSPAVARRVLVIKQLVSREVGELNAHHIGCESHWPLVIVHLGGEPGGTDCLCRPHAHLGPDDTTIKRPFTSAVRSQGQPQKPNGAPKVSSRDVETTLAMSVAAVC